MTDMDMKNKTGAQIFKETMDKRQPLQTVVGANSHCPSSDMLESIVRKHALAVEELTEAQLVKVMRQMIASGDITRHVHEDTQAITYVPYRDVWRLKNKIEDLEAIIAENTNEAANLRY
jgi:hypothetical protein